MCIKLIGGSAAITLLALTSSTPGRRDALLEQCECLAELPAAVSFAGSLLVQSPALRRALCCWSTRTRKVGAEYIALPADLVITSRSTHHRRRSAMKSLMTPVALAALAGSEATAKTSPRYREQLLPAYAPGSRLIQDPNVVIEDGRIISAFERSAANGEGLL
jgi:hypothetical protein